MNVIQAYRMGEEDRKDIDSKSFITSEVLDIHRSYANSTPIFTELSDLQERLDKHQEQVVGMNPLQKIAYHLGLKSN